MATIKPKKRPITDEIATAEKDITRGYIGNILLNPDTVLSTEGSGKGLELYEKLFLDHRIFAEMQKRKLAVTGKEWEVLPASDDPQDQEIADFVKKVFEKFSYDTARQALLSGIVLGFKPGEIMWDYSEGDIWVKKIIPRSSRRFVFDLQGNMRLLTWSNMLQGEELPDRKFIVFTNPSDNGSPYGDGIGRVLYWCSWFRKNGTKFEAVFLDKYGSPTAVGKYPPGTDKGIQDKLFDACEAIQSSSAVTIPDNVMIELLEAARAAQTNGYESWRKFWDDAITFVILGQTATTQGTPGKLGAETAQSDIREEIVKADADLLCECQNHTLIKWIVDYNFPNVKEYPQVWIRTEPEEDLKPLAERDRIIVKEIGLPTAKSYFYDTYGIPEPLQDEELIVVPQSPSPFGQSPTFAERRGQGVKGSRGQVKSKNKSLNPRTLESSNPALRFAEQDWVSWYIDQLGPSLKNIKSDALAKIETYLRSQSSPPSEEEFTSAVQGILGDAYKNIDKIAVADAVSGIYQAVKGFEAAIGFGGADIRAINFLSNLDHFYLSKFIDNPDAQAALTDFLKTRYLEGGEGLFGAGDPKTIAEMKNLLSQNLTDLEGYQINRIVDTGVVKIKNWAHISQINDAGIAEIEIIEPTMECPFCAMMNGKIIQVDVAYRKMMDQANMSDGEYQQFLQDNPPELTSIQDFVDQGLLPPYHPHCRGTIITRVG